MFVEDADAAEKVKDNLRVVATAGDDGPWNMQDENAVSEEHVRDNLGVVATAGDDGPWNITDNASRPSEEIVHSFVYCGAGRLDDDSVRTQAVCLAEHPVWVVYTGDMKKEVGFTSFGYPMPCHGSWR